MSSLFRDKENNDPISIIYLIESCKILGMTGLFELEIFSVWRAWPILCLE